MRPLVLALLVLVPLAVHAQDADSTYAALVAQLRAGDTAVDFTALRMAHTETEAYSPYNTDPKERRGRMFRALFDDDNAPLALAIADSSLDDFYPDIDAHMVASIAHSAMGDEEAADFHHAVVEGLAGSILASGEGLTPESPYVVISVSEEYAMLRISGLESRGQALTTCAGSPCDRMEVEHIETGDTFTVYFDVSLPMNWMSRDLGGE